MVDAADLGPMPSLNRSGSVFDLQVLTRPTWRRRYASSDMKGRSRKAVFVLCRNARSSIPAVGRLLDEKDLAGTATTALFAIGKDSIPELVHACSHTNPSVRAQAAFVLSKLMPGGGGYTTSYVPVGST